MCIALSKLLFFSNAVNNLVAELLSIQWPCKCFLVVAPISCCGFVLGLFVETEFKDYTIVHMV